MPLAALGGSTFGAFSDGTRFLQAVLLGAGMTLFFALVLRIERLTQLHYERVGYDPAARRLASRPSTGGRGRALALHCFQWGAMTVAFWGVERAKGAPVSWLFSGIAMALVLLVVAAFRYLLERKSRRVASADRLGIVDRHRPSRGPNVSSASVSDARALRK
ncbi:hypothetical protein ACRAWF_08220 [Streptomyces sp. L7]